MFAFPLTPSFAADMAFDAQSAPTQPVGVAVVGMLTEGRKVEEQQLVFTRVVLDLFGPLIAQRWTNQRMSGLYGNIYRVNHSDLTNTWNALKSLILKLLESCEDDDLYAATKDQIAKHRRQVAQIAAAREAIRRVEEQTRETVNLRDLLDERSPAWQEEWPGCQDQCQLSLDYSEVPPDLRLDCGALTLATTFTCLLRNAVEAASFALREGIRTNPMAHVTVRVANLDDTQDYFSIRVEDDAGGVDESTVPFLFVKGKAGPAGGGGTGLALARAGLLTSQADLQYVGGSDDHGAIFGILLRRGNAGASIRTSERRDSRRR